MKASPPVLLVTTGALLGLTFPLGRLATDAGISPLVWAWLISSGSALLLWLTLLLRGKSVSISPQFLKYCLLLSICSLALPNILIFVVIPKLGSGFTSILFTLSPIFTLLLSSLWQVRVPSWLGVLGILIGSVGGIIVGITRGELGSPAGFEWILLGLCIPITLAIGNIYRTVGWPPSATPLELAVGTNLLAATLLLLLIVAISDLSAMADLVTHAKLSLAQVLVSAAMFSVFFRLQQVGGPTYLSQIGYVAASLALFVGTVYLGERYSLVTWLGAAVIVVGVIVTVVADVRARRVE